MAIVADQRLKGIMAGLAVELAVGLAAPSFAQPAVPSGVIPGRDVLEGQVSPERPREGRRVR
ncbi:hypothetical protein FHS79_003260, partial [Polymorphobacter multimanifer]